MSRKRVLTKSPQRIKLSKSLLNKAYDEQTIFKKIKSCINQYQLFQ